MDFSSKDIPALPAPKEITSGYTTLASVDNGEIRLSFAALSEDGTIVSKTDYFSRGSWRRFAGKEEDNRVAIISSAANPAVNHNSYYPAWNAAGVERTLSFEGRNYPVIADGDNNNPFSLAH